MGVAYNSRIVTDGLVVCLDAANRKSYPGDGNTWIDLSMVGNHGTLQNTTTFMANTNSFYFNGTNNRILIACNNSTVRTYNSTTQFVVKLPVYSGGQRAIMSYRDGGGGSLYIGKQSNGIFCFYDHLNTPAFTVGNIAANATVMVHVTCNVAGGLISTFINGALIGSASRTGWIANYHTSLYLGYDPGTNEYMLGDFYHMAHYSRVLSDAEIQQNFNALRSRYGI